MSEFAIEMALNVKETNDMHLLMITYLYYK